MKKLRIVVHNQENLPLFIELMIDDGLATALDSFKVRRVEFLISDMNLLSFPQGIPNRKTPIVDLGNLPKTPPKADLGDFKIGSS